MLGPYEMITRLVVALLLGVILGIERVVANKTAGMRTYGLVSMAAALFVIISDIVSTQFIAEGGSMDPLRMASQIIVGIGFIGGGSILFRKPKLSGLTTAVGLWVAAGIGMASGFGLYTIATAATVLTLLVFTVLWFLESAIKKSLHHFRKKSDENNT